MEVKCLDHGFVRLRNISGPTRRDGVFDASDRDPAQVARMSFDQMNSDRLLEDDLRLSRYLMKNWHTSPFEMVEIWLDMKLPLFVARHFDQHRTASTNEVSGRYITLSEEWYIPKVVGGKAKSNKQGQEDNLGEPMQIWFKENLNITCKDSYEMYLSAMEDGVAPEHARLFLHVNHYTHWLWKQDLHNMMHLLALRDHSHSQIETQQYAKAIKSLLEQFLPETMKLFDEYRRFS
jgi:thymidylate synthase (FAD)